MKHIAARLWVKFENWLWRDDHWQRQWQERAIQTLMNVAVRIEQAEMAKREWTRMADRRPIARQACVIWALEKDDERVGSSYTFDTAQYRESGEWESLDGDREWPSWQVKSWAYVENPPND